MIVGDSIIKSEKITQNGRKNKNENKMEIKLI